MLLMETSTRWVTFFSQSGQEILELSKRLGRFPDLILTNQCDPTKICDELFIRGVTYLESNQVEEYEKYLVEGDLITLHGFLRIVPAEVCERYRTIYNGHPGLITAYSNLKGKDPQLKAYQLKLTRIGSVVHLCTPELDSGCILSLRSTTIPLDSSLDTYYNSLRATSLDAWLAFFDSIINKRELRCYP